MAIRVSCDSCGATIKADDKHAGKRVRCPKCQEVLTIPTAASEEQDDGESDFFEDSKPAAPPSPPPSAPPTLKSTFRPAPGRSSGASPRRPVASDSPINRNRSAPQPEEEPAPSPEEDPLGYAAESEPTAAVVEDDFSSLTTNDLEGEPVLEDAPRKPKKKKKSGESKKAKQQAAATGWRQNLHWLFLVALIPLCLNSFMEGASLEERVQETITEHKLDEAEIEEDEEDEGDGGFVYDGLQQIAMAAPDHRINGAFLAADSWLHWVFAVLSASAFLALILFLYPKEEAGLFTLLAVGLVTGTFGIAMLLAFQFIAVTTGGIRIWGRGIAVLIFMVIKFIGFSYRCAIDPDTGFGLSFMGFTCGVGLCEELCKAIPVAVYLNNTPKATWRDACLIGLASGVGFGVSEGITYAGNYYNGLQGGWIYLVRFLSCVALHALWAGAIGMMMYHNQDYIGELSFESALMFVVVYLSAGMVLHGLYDTFLKSGMELGALITAGVSFGWFAYVLARSRETEGA